MNSTHHKDLITELRKHQLAAGGPISLTHLLRMSGSKIGALRVNRVKWNWIASRVLAAHQTTPAVELPEDMPLAGRRSVRQLSTLWQRVAPDTSKDTADRRADVRPDETGHPNGDPYALPSSAGASHASDDVPSTPRPWAHAPRARPSGDTTANRTRLERMRAAKRLPTINDQIRGDGNENS